MRYPEGHKQRSRNTIIKVAARLFRQHGYDGVSIDILMAAAGLTRGSFYSHFKSKRDLYEAVLGGEHEFIDRMQSRDGVTVPQLSRQGIKIASDYLHPDHRPGVIRGCALASLAMDTARSSSSAQKAYGAVVRELVKEFRRGIDDDRKLDERALAALATCVGGLLISGACAADSELSTAVSRASTKNVAKTLGSNI